MNNQQAYALGILWADGYFLEKRNEIRLEVVATDFIDFEFPLSHLGKYLIQQRKRSNRQPQIRATIHNKHLCETLRSYDFHNKSHNSPNTLLQTLPPEQQRCFILGWIDGDGCFYSNFKNKCFQFSLAGSFSQDWSAFEKICVDLKIKYSIQRNVQKNGNRSSHLRITNRSGLKTLIKYLYKPDLSIGLTRKKQKAQQILSYLEELK